MSRIITLTTDFGLKDEYVSSVKAVIKKINPDAEIIDISHEIMPFSILEGAFVLSSAAPQFPRAVHVCVVDPGVGSCRIPLALKTSFGHWLVGPDNGCLIPAAERLGGINEAYRLKPELYARHRISSTFHGRDVFAPAAALIAKSDDASELGELIDEKELVPSPFVCEVIGNRLRTVVGNIDRFGTVRFTVLFSELLKIRSPLERIILKTETGKWELNYSEYFSAVSEGLLFFYEDSSGYLSVSANKGSADKILNLGLSDEVLIEIE
jgi:hypothetical protein